MVLRRNRRSYAKHKERARALAHARLAYFNAHYGFSWGRVAIKNHTSRWGSCSRKGNLNFSYQIALLPEALADYIIVHELCHLGEFNHSPRFWALVARACPNHKELRRALRQ
jgi:predicted metal-dependent hydrolase